MNSLPTQAFTIAATAVLAAVVALMSSTLAGAVASTLIAGILACVAFAAQSRQLRDEQRLVYRPVYVRDQSVQRRVRSED